jgi:deoxyinosine 3'endonuclease (endonuclease V)
VWLAYWLYLHDGQAGDGNEQMLPCTRAEYVPGQFYKRELPLLRAVIDNLPSRPSMLIIDGYVWLGATDAPGLGAHLFEARRNANCWRS